MLAQQCGCVFSPPVTVREQLTAAKLSGQPFDEAWAGTVAALARTARLEWQSALQETREAWERAYGDVPATGAETALAFLALADDDLVWRDLAPLPRSRPVRKAA